ncbi:ABC transporter ATP-binding protein [Breznakiella homolactica]|uniref:ABC transporter ATP-binding protein n=1 Tax=Breznakiella homolactica TaxID=2798577 RepID=A0A7T7XM26_9SPIR|nr:ABC transporter ATP-binding protein [Breznakiella homolactica]QQO08859.1 ABC transporter ATP-binding protein [Breznakiella homolactica]
METILDVTDLRKRYGSLAAVGGVSFTVGRGEIFGLLGHNGAGKTTVLECVLGVRTPDSGTIRLLGMDPREQRKKVFSRVGVQFQETRFQDKLRVGEACELAASLYRRPKDWRELLRHFSLSDKEGLPVSALSGGERQTLAVVIAQVHEPEVLFLDELTTGLDPAARRSVWAYIKELKAQGVSVILTSHYMDEVEYLCDRIALMRSGTLAALGRPEELLEIHEKKCLEDVFLLYMEKEMEAV